MTEAEMERIADRIVWQRLVTDRAYLHPENPEAQVRREDEIGKQVWNELVAKHGEPS
jgi:hypothetical protein